MGKIVFIKAGLLTTIQDKGRLGLVDKGIPLSGPMDEEAFHLANLLVRNDFGAACLEIYIDNIKLYFTENCQIVFTGANAKIEIGSKIYFTNEIINVSAGTKLNISSYIQGQWLYMAINGSFESENVLGSQCFYQKISKLSKFSDSDVLTYSSSPSPIPPSYSKIKAKVFPKMMLIPAYPGHSFGSLNEMQQLALKNTTFTLSTIQNRMGIQVVEKIKHKLPELISSPVYPGTVQLTHAGKIIILMKDAQVTGGYHRILQLTVTGISRLAQLRPHSKFKFDLLK